LWGGGLGYMKVPSKLSGTEASTKMQIIIISQRGLILALTP